jgi:CDP-glucose 4,6-dehydratase
VIVPLSFANAFAGRSVLVTGHTGFKGSWLCLWLDRLGAQVSGYALDPPTEPSNFVAARVGEVLVADVRADLRDRETLAATIAAAKPELILHLAAQSVVRQGYADPVGTFDVNVMGTVAVLDAVRQLHQPCAIVVVTSDKAYENDGSGRPLTESDRLGGSDPYSASKGAAEIVTAAYRRSFFAPAELARHGVALATARAGNVVGGGDWTADGIVADMIRALTAGQPVPVRNPAAVRPWEHVLEPLSGYLTLAAALLGPAAATAARGWNFGPADTDAATVEQVVDAFLRAWGSGTWESVGRPDDPPEAALLRLSIEHTARDLGWTPRWGFAETIQRTSAWYRRYFADPAAARQACLDDIEAYELALV